MKKFTLLTITIIVLLAMVFVGCTDTPTTTSGSGGIFTALAGNATANTITLGWDWTAAQTWYTGVITPEVPWALFIIAISDADAANASLALLAYDAANTVNASGMTNAAGISHIIRGCAGNTFSTATAYDDGETFFEGGNVVFQESDGSDALANWSEVKFLSANVAGGADADLSADLTVASGTWTFGLATAGLTLAAGDDIAVITTGKIAAWGGPGAGILASLPTGSANSPLPSGSDLTMTVSAWTAVE